MLRVKASTSVQRWSSLYSNAQTGFSTPISLAISSIQSSTSESSPPAADFLSRSLMRFFMSAVESLTFSLI